MIYSQNKIISASLCGADAKLSSIGLLSIAQDSLTELMKILEIDGITAMNKYNAVIVFTKNHAKILRDINWGDNVTVESFISSKSLVRFCIDICIKNAESEILAYSRIELCAIDIDSKRIRKIDTVGVDDLIVVTKPLIDMDFSSKEQIKLSFVEDVKVRSSNIDYVHHTNNVEYMRFLINTFDFNDLISSPIRDIEIYYINQSFEGDNLQIYSNKTSNNKHVFEIKKQEQSIIYCTMTMDNK